MVTTNGVSVDTSQENKAIDVVGVGGQILVTLSEKPGSVSVAISLSPELYAMILSHEARLVGHGL